MQRNSQSVLSLLRKALSKVRRTHLPQVSVGIKISSVMTANIESWLVMRRVVAH